MEPTIKQVLNEVTASGFFVRKARVKVAGKTAYKVDGRPGLFTKTGLMKLTRLYWAETDENDKPIDNN